MAAGGAEGRVRVRELSFGLLLLIAAGSASLEDLLAAVEEGRDDDELPDEGAADEVEDEPGAGGVGDEHGGRVGDARRLDEVDGQQAADEGEDVGHGGEGARRGEGLLEEGDEEAGGRAEQRHVAQPGHAAARVALREEERDVDVRVHKEHDPRQRREQDRRQEKVVVAEDVNRRLHGSLVARLPSHVVHAGLLSS